MTKKAKTFVITFAILSALCLTLLPASSTYASCPDDISSYWKLDEATGSTYADFIKDNDGTGNVDPTAVVGQINGAQEFNGTDTQINVPADRSFDWYVDESFSIEYWIKKETASGANEIAVGRDDATTQLQWWTGLSRDGKASFILRGKDNSGSDGDVLFGIGPVLSDGSWHHVVAVRDGINDQNILYVDGEEEGKVDVTYTDGFDSTSSALNIGWLNYNAGFYFGGSLDEIALYDRALSPDEIEEHYDAGLAGQDYCLGSAPFVPFPDDTISLWELDEPTPGAPNGTYVDSFDGNDGTGNDNPTAVAGTVNGAQQFDGSTTGIDVAADRSFDWYVDESFSIEYWVKRDAAPGAVEVAVGRDDSTSQLQWWTGLNADGKASFILRAKDNSGTAGDVLFGVGPVIADENWHHVVAVRDGVNGKNILYVDGVAVGNPDVNYTDGFDSTSSALNIGWLNYNAGFYFGGSLDEIALYDRALSSDEIEEHYDDGLLGIGIDDTDTVGGTAEIIGTWIGTGTDNDGIWYRDVAGSSWTQMTTSVTDGDIAAGDFTGDGIADVASIWPSGLYYQDGATLDWSKKVGSAPNRVTAGDVTGDGRPEIIGTWIGTGTDNDGIWYWDVAESSWTQMTTSVTDGDIAAGDFTGDGIADVASIWPNGLYYQDGATLDWSKKVGSAPNRVTAGDVTGDGRPEIIGTWIGTGTDNDGIWYWDVAESSWTQMTTSVTDGDIAAGDFTGDGIADVASIWPSGLYYQDGATLDWSKKVGTAPNNVTAGDVTGD